MLRVELSVRNDRAGRFCYVLEDGQLSPTLRLKPGDLLVLRLTNELTGTGGGPAHLRGGGSDPCISGMMTLTSANLHFHGLSIPSVCHQDEVLQDIDTADGSTV